MFGLTIAAIVPAIVSFADPTGFSPTDLGTQLAAIAPTVLAYIGIGVVGGFGVYGAGLGIDRGLKHFSKLAKK